MSDYKTLCIYRRNASINYACRRPVRENTTNTNNNVKLIPIKLLYCSVRDYGFSCNWRANSSGKEGRRKKYIEKNRSPTIATEENYNISYRRLPSVANYFRRYVPKIIIFFFFVPSVSSNREKYFSEILIFPRTVDLPSLLVWAVEIGLMRACKTKSLYRSESFTLREISKKKRSNIIFSKKKMVLSIITRDSSADDNINYFLLEIIYIYIYKNLIISKSLVQYTRRKHICLSIKNEINVLMNRVR